MSAILSGRFYWLAIGMLVGSLSSGFLPHSPLYASATHGADGFAIATGDVDDGIEGLYVLDHVTGELKGAVFNPIARKFTGFYQSNILQDFGVTAGGGDTRFLMVTGVADMRRGAGKFRMARSVVYIADVKSGTVAVYGVPWAPERVASGGGITGTFQLLDAAKFRTVAVRQ